MDLLNRRTFISTTAAVALAGSVSLAAKPTHTAIVVTDMHCGTCAKKIAAKLYVVPGVVEVRADVKADTAYAIPQRNKQPSPRALWEAVESAGFEVVKLVGPYGQFTSKPAQ